jgi:hypothetical protein
METVFSVAKELEVELSENYSDARLRKIIFDYGMDSTDLTRKEMIQEIVDLEVYAFTH